MAFPVPFTAENVSQSGTSPTDQDAPLVDTLTDNTSFHSLLHDIDNECLPPSVVKSTVEGETVK